MTSTEIQSEIGEKKQLLDQTDYEVIKAVESFFTAATSASTILGLIKAIKEAVEGITQLLTDRAEWRARVNELEAMEPTEYK